MFRDAVFEGKQKIHDFFFEEKRKFFADLRAGDQAAVAALLKKKPRALRWREGLLKETPLHVACKHGHKDLALYLLDRGAPIEAKTPLGERPLVSAIKGESGDVALALIARGADIHWTGKFQLTVMDCAAWHGQLEVVQELQQRGLPLKTHQSLMHAAAYMGHKHVLEYLKDQKISLEEADINGGTPLMSAAGRGHSEVIQFLLDNDVDYERADNRGQKAEEIARDCKQPHAAAMIEGRRVADNIRRIAQGLPDDITFRRLRLRLSP